ncbi:GDSL-type esterase/lipase family protein [Thiomicrorhabdus cannonii]|uniref:GDSL-type esterase/lipase family protein n=1 Tax=Thiomicrorhabdus cannonii TaxID=2748011 RepID=UPI0015B86384|nr:GDSL-type esterase/lipase family protein [Thiomicrorhabdus cannonii]
MKIALKLVLPIIWVFFLAGCAKPQLPPLQDEDTIVAFGDSLTLGVGVKPEQSYPAVLARLSGRKVINAGVSGETTAQGLERLAEVVAAHQPKLVILLEGGNDMLQKQPEESIAANLGNMIASLQDEGIGVLLVSVPEKGVWMRAAPWYEELADEYAVPLEDEIVPELMGRLTMKSDYVHFNAQGYEALAQAILVKLQEAGALLTP